ncbi:hypothetical protein AMJ52_08550 [candidate division TA06 bacterium DG_78]|uniref:Uncharacterized protein n=1 Tax=candidate division TA06 bacterium DG_78 TaxID=1703772 RepID=A0A0S7YAA0_UNCT6|nr:MAG: hypothetical protein AMJ52_08550 [candidate division TA06 bacterium DG_78]
MSLHKSRGTSFKEKVKAVERYLQTGTSLRIVAREIGVPYKTLWFWVKLYKEQGIESLRLQRFYRKRLPIHIEKRVMLLKENNPALTIRQAQQQLRKASIKVSKKGIWGIWRRYGFIGISKVRQQNPMSVFVDLTPQLDSEIKRAEVFVSKNDVQSAASILNNLPCLPRCDILKKIPEELLSIRRKLELLYLQLDEIPYPLLLKRIKKVGKSLEKKGYIYSSIYADILELDALGWIGKPKARIKVFERLAKKMHGIKDSLLLFFFYFDQASTYASLLQMSEALKYIKKCRRLIHLLPHPNYKELFGNLLTHVGRYKEACFFYKRALKGSRSSEVVERVALKLATCVYSYSGEYAECKKMLTKAQAVRNKTGLGATYSITKASLAFGQGNLTDASQYFVQSLEKASKGELHNRIYATAIGLASVAMALNNKKQAHLYLKKYLPLMNKHRLVREALILRCLSCLTKKIPKELLHMPPIRLLNLLIVAKKTMRTGEYRNAFNFAQMHKLLGILHRWIVFFPEPILLLLEKGKQTGLPRVILKFPIFNQNIPVYHIKFLGKLTVSKNQQHLKIKLTPKEKSFLIHLTLRANTMGKFILLDDLSNNFWPGKRNTLSLTMLILAQLKKKLRMPRHLLSISSKYGGPKLCNLGIYFINDFDEYKTLLTQAKFLERADEWQIARREYLRAFALLRGEPFKKMYDNWSENMRTVVLNRLETETIRFAKTHLSHKIQESLKDLHDIRTVIENVLKIIPYSEKIKEIQKNIHSISFKHTQKR